MDYKSLSDQALEDHLNMILNEKERRQHLNQIPGQIQMLAHQFRTGGGDRAELEAAIQ